MKITLDALLQSRDKRAAYQRYLLGEYPGKTLLCLTVVMPGEVKRNLYSLVVAQAAVSALIARFGSDIIHAETCDQPTGYEAYLLTSMPLRDAKRAVCHIEDSHPLGRLFDIDVIAPDGIPLSRQEVGEPMRKCLLCDNEARFCMRNHTHTSGELMARIKEMVEDYAGGHE